MDCLMSVHPMSVPLRAFPTAVDTVLGPVMVKVLKSSLS